MIWKEVAVAYLKLLVLRSPGQNAESQYTQLRSLESNRALLDTGPYL
jgi:hypothetical protein